MRVIFVFGTRPEAIKLSPIIKKIKKEKKIKSKICITAQHRSLLDQVLNTFSIKADYDLDIMTEDQSLEYITSVTIKKLDEIFEKEKFDLVIIQGDTTTALATAIEAYYKKLKIAHVEAGLRTHDKFNPFPEEINRTLIDKICDFHFAPTKRAKENLIQEGIDDIFLSGNTIVDALQSFIKEPPPKQQKKIILLTIHRRESFGKPLKRIFDSIKRIATKFKEIELIYPVHPNPNVKSLAYKKLNHIKNIQLIKPLEYKELLRTMQKSYLIITDSGGIQEEAPTLRKPVLVVREKTERIESIELGLAKLVGTDPDSIFNACSELIKDKEKYKSMIKGFNPYGDGKSAERIVGYIKYRFGLSKYPPREFTPKYM